MKTLIALLGMLPIIYMSADNKSIDPVPPAHAPAGDIWQDTSSHHINGMKNDQRETSSNNSRNPIRKPPTDPLNSNIDHRNNSGNPRDTSRLYE